MSDQPTNHTHRPSMLLRIADLQRELRIGRTSVYTLVATDPTFPRPIQLTPRAVAWRREDVEAWVSSRPLAEAHVHATLADAPTRDAA